MIDWRPISKMPPYNKPLLLWHVGARCAVIGSAYPYQDNTWGFSSTSARGFRWTHWALIHNPRGKLVSNDAGLP